MAPTRRSALLSRSARAQESRPAEVTVGIWPGPGGRVPGRTVWPDLLITHRGCVVGVEVDGPDHRGRLAADQSRDRQLTDAGLLFVERIVVEDTEDVRELDVFAERFLARLLVR